MVRMRDHRGNTSYGARVIACFLILGGLLGIIASVLRGFDSVQHRDPRLTSVIIALALFAWGILTGIWLWQAKPRGLKWAKLLFALQIPVFSIVHVSYEFSTLFSFRLMIGHTSRHVGANLGSSSNIYWSVQSPGFLLGINLVAVMVVLYLIGSSKSIHIAGRTLRQRVSPA